jgi:hypothetical protein
MERRIGQDRRSQSFLILICSADWSEQETRSPAIAPHKNHLTKTRSPFTAKTYDRKRMTPDTAAYKPKGRPAFETNARSRRSQTLSRCWGDRHDSPRVLRFGDRPVAFAGLRWQGNAKMCKRVHLYT